MMSHIKSVEFYLRGNTYELEIDTEDPDNMVIENITLIDGHVVSNNMMTKGTDSDIDPEVFTDNLDADDWVRINEKLELLGEKK